MGDRLHAGRSYFAIGAKLLIAAATALTLAVADPSEVKASHGGGWHGGGWHEAGGWRGGARWHDSGRHVGWHAHGWGGPGPSFASAHLWHGWRGPGFGSGCALVGLAPRLGLDRFWLGRMEAGAALLVGASFGVVVAPPLIVAPPPIYIAPPPIVVGLPAIYPPPIAAAAPPPVAAAAPSAPSTGGLFGATLPPPIVVLPPPAIVVAVAPPLVIFTPPAFSLFIGPPVLAFATIGPNWWSGGYITGGFAAIGARAAIAPFSRRGAGLVRASVGFHGRPAGRFPGGRGWRWALAWSPMGPRLRQMAGGCFARCRLRRLA